MVPFGQNDVFINARLDVVYHTAEVATAGVGRNHNLTLHVFTVDGVRCVRRTYVCHLRKWNHASAGIADGHVLDALGSGARIFIGSDNKVEYLVAFIDVRNHFSSKANANPFVELGQTDAVACQHFVLGDYG